MNVTLQKSFRISEPRKFVEKKNHLKADPITQIKLDSFVQPHALKLVTNCWASMFCLDQHWPWFCGFFVRNDIHVMSTSHFYRWRFQYLGDSPWNALEDILLCCNNHLHSHSQEDSVRNDRRMFCLPLKDKWRKQCIVG